MSHILNTHDYNYWLVDLKSKIKQSQIKAALAVNSQLIMLYWEMGRQIVEKQENAKWGSGFINQLSKDLRAEFPDMGGFSVSNIKYCKQFYSYYRLFSIGQQPVGQLKISESEKGQQPVGQLKMEKKLKPKQLVSQSEFSPNQVLILEQLVPELLNKLVVIPWGHHVTILQKIKNQQEALFYIQQTIENNWSRSVLQMQIETNLYGRQGKAISNFKNTLPESDSDLAIALLKDPYNFEFLSLGRQLKERDLEQKLIENISRFLLELGKGLCLYGQAICGKCGRPGI